MLGLILEIIIRFFLMFILEWMNQDAYGPVDLEIRCWEDHSGCWIQDNLSQDDHKYFYIIFPNGD